MQFKQKNTIHCIELHRGKLRKIYGAKNIAILYAHFVRKKIANSEFNQDKWCGRSGERGAQIGRSHSPASVLAKEPKVERRKFPSRESRQFFAGNLPTNRQLQYYVYYYVEPDDAKLPYFLPFVPKGVTKAQRQIQLTREKRDETTHGNMGFESNYIQKVVTNKLS